MMNNTISKLKLANFTAFSQLDLDLGSGINVFIGSNPTGKTHIMKLLYASCDITRTKEPFANKLLKVFMPHGMKLGRLVRRQRGSRIAEVQVERGENRIDLSFFNHTESPGSAAVRLQDKWQKSKLECAYIPVKEMLAHAPGFRSLYASRDIHFEEIYSDIVDRAYRPLLRGRVDQRRQSILEILQSCMEGKVTVKEEEFFLRNKQGNLEFSLLAEGLRKLALLWLLIQNGTLLEGAILFWDEPESNLNPEVIDKVTDILLELQRLGVQIFIATHDYVVLKQFDLKATSDDIIRYHSLSRGTLDEGVLCSSTDNYSRIETNAILDTFEKMYEWQLEKARSQSFD